MPERHELRKSPITERAQEAAVESAAVGGGGKTNGNKAIQAICTAVTNIFVVESTTSITTHSSKFNSVTFMRPRYSRRVHSKSEPHPTSPASASGSVAGNESPAKRADGSITSVRIMKSSVVVAQCD